MTKTDPFIDRQLDLNLNLGEGFGYRRAELEDKVLPYVTSVNLASGAHSGDPAVIDRALKRCKEHTEIAVGALVSYPDLVGFGLRRIDLPLEDLRAAVISQIGALAALAKSNNYELEHVRVHGYLYDQLASNYAVAETVARAVQEFSKWLILVGPSGPVLQEVASWTNIRVSGEARYDLRYGSEAQLLPYDREKDGNLDMDLIAQRARDLIYKSTAQSEDGKEVKLKFETMHLTCDAANSVEAAKLIRGMLVKALPLKSLDYEPYLSELI